MSDGARRRAVAIAAGTATIGTVLLLALSHGAKQRAPGDAPDAVPTLSTSLETTAAPEPAPPRAEGSTAPLAAAAGVGALTPDAGAFDEAELMRLLRSASGNDPALAVELAREGNRRFPASPEAPERTSIMIHALSEQGLTSEARGAAEDMVNRYPDSSWVREIERFTGAHRHRNIRVDAQGRLEYYDPPS